MKIAHTHLQIAKLRNQWRFPILLQINFNRLFPSLEWYFAKQRATLDQIQIIFGTKTDLATRSNLDFNEFLDVFGNNIITMKPNSLHILASLLQLRQTIGIHDSSGQFGTPKSTFGDFIFFDLVKHAEIGLHDLVVVLGVLCQLIHYCLVLFLILEVLSSYHLGRYQVLDIGCVSHSKID